MQIFHILLGMCGLTLCDPGGGGRGGGPKDPQVSISPNALKWLLKSRWNVFDFSYIDLKTRPSSNLEAATMYKLKGQSLNMQTGQGFK